MFPSTSTVTAAFGPRQNDAGARQCVAKNSGTAACRRVRSQARNHWMPSTSGAVAHGSAFRMITCAGLERRLLRLPPRIDIGGCRG